MVNNEPLLNEFQDKFEQNMKLVLKEPGLKSTELLRYYNNKLEEFHADPFSLSIDQFLYNVSTDLTLGIDESRLLRRKNSFFLPQVYTNPAGVS